MRDSPDLAAKPRAVREMFSSIAHRYDFLNHFLSLNVDKRWRGACVRAVSRKVGNGTARAGGLRILDVGCGTADLALELSALGRVAGCDFSHPMLCLGNRKVARGTRGHAVALLEGDAMRLPFPDGCFDVVASAFVLRNLADIDGGLAEMRRVLRAGGAVAVLDFGMPRVPVLGPAYRLYFTRVLPAIGRAISGVDGPYRYLPESVETFPEPEELAERAARAGFVKVEHKRLTGGIAFLLLASK
jgi:demethylmenaquinone methyltransferase/2-methoxy-6-polyprenyl-1,4-benzoquinol methylase